MCLFTKKTYQKAEISHTYHTWKIQVYIHTLWRRGSSTSASKWRGVLLGGSERLANSWDSCVYSINYVFKGTWSFRCFSMPFLLMHGTPPNQETFLQEREKMTETTKMQFVWKRPNFTNGLPQTKKRPSHRLLKEFKTHELIEFWEKKSRVPTVTPCPAGTKSSTKLSGIQGAVSKKRLRATRIWSFPPRQKA